MERVRLNIAAFYAALDRRRIVRGMTWQRVANETGLSVITFYRLAKGKNVSADALCTLLDWLGSPVSDRYTVDGEDDGGSN